MPFTSETFTLNATFLHPDYGWLILQAAAPGTKRTQTHRNYHVKYILDGSVINLFDDKKIHLQKGQGIFIPPNKNYTVISENGYKILDLVLTSWHRSNKIVYNEFLKLTNNDVTVTAPLNLNLTYDELRHIITVPTDLNHILIGNKSEYMALSVLDELSRNKKSDFMQKIEAITNSDNVNFNLKELCEITGYSQTHFERLMIKHFGCSGIEYFNRIRINNICTLLRTTSLTLPEIAEKTNFYDTSHLNFFFKKRMGTTPGKYRKNHL